MDDSLPPLRTFTPEATQALLSTSESLASAIDETQLLNSFCSNSVQSGRYVLAWYGRVLNDSEQRIVPIASAGTAVAYLNDLLVTADESSTGRGPIGQALRTRQITTVQDVSMPSAGHGQPDFAPWRERAAAVNIKSCTAIPVLVNGVVDGVLAIYSSTAEPFGDQAHAIHQAMARQVGIGIERLRGIDRYVASLKGTVKALSATIDTRDPYTAGHQASVADLAERVARKMGLFDFDIEGISVAGMLHDIGKIAVPSQILLKPGNLTLEERQLVQTHAHIGQRILEDVEFPWPVAAVVGAHHERLDGSGYPLGLVGEEIAIQARIVSVADVFDALASSRPYRPGYTHHEVLTYLTDRAGTQFDADAVSALVALNPTELRGHRPEPGKLPPLPRLPTPL
ncbi:MAG: HD domain-containing phosphohydrolase [Propionibacteriaceae bacterium]